MVDALIRAVTLKRDGVDDFAAYPFSIPAIRQLDELQLDPHVTLFAGENGSGKSTLVEAIAVAAGFNPEGGSRHVQLATRVSHSPLHEHLRLIRGNRRPKTGYFLRAESFFNVATYLERLDGGLLPYGGRALHDQSHGESFISLLKHRFVPGGLYVLDEPEAALSLHGVLALMRRMYELIAADSQFIISTHSPVLLGYPGAKIYVLSESGMTETTYESAEVVTLTRAFLEDRASFLRHLFEDETGSR